MRLIDADALKQAITARRRDGMCYDSLGNAHDLLHKQDVIAMIEMANTVDGTCEPTRRIRRLADKVNKTGEPSATMWYDLYDPKKVVRLVVTAEPWGEVQEDSDEQGE